MRVMVRYRIKPEHVQQNLDALSAVYEELESIRPDWLSYSTYQLEDTVSFVALVVVDDPGRLGAFPAFRAYRSSLEQRCDEPPVTTEVRQVGAFGRD